MAEMKRVLLNWFEAPGRPEQLTVFSDIADRIEFIHLFHRTRADRSEEVSPFQMIYWFDFKSPWQLLEEVRPDKVITMNADDLLSISLIVASRHKGITTYAMQHGFIPDNLEDILITMEREPITAKGTLRKYIRLFSFFLSSIRPFALSRLGQYFRFLYLYFRKGPGSATKKLQYAWRKPDYYLCFSKHSGRYYQERDQVTENRLLEVGVPMFDDFFKKSKERHFETATGVNDKDYYLLIDTSFDEYIKKIETSEIERCYTELAEYCKERNSVLKVKLHPWNYQNSTLKDTEYIQFYRSLTPTNLNELIFNSKACFGFYSTLTMPVVCVKKLCQVVYDNVCFQELISQGITPAIDFFTFRKEDIKLDEFEVNLENLEAFSKKYLYKTDGNSAERLYKILSASDN